MCSRIMHANSFLQDIDATGPERAHAPQLTQKTTIASSLEGIEGIHDDISAFLDGLEEELSEYAPGLYCSYCELTSASVFSIVSK